MDYDYYDDDPPLIRDADIEAAELAEAGRDFDRSLRRAKKLFLAGDLAGAAKACPHGWGYPTDALAATHSKDPRAGEPGFRCIHCGSWFADDPFAVRSPRVKAACEFKPFEA